MKSTTSGVYKKGTRLYDDANSIRNSELSSKAGGKTEGWKKNHHLELDEANWMG